MHDYDWTATGVSYGRGRTQVATVYRPDAPGDRPVAFMVHGGGWVAGSRGDWAGEAEIWTRRGWLVVNVDYTRGDLAGPGGIGVQIEDDISTVVERFTYDHQADRERMVIMGDSAGGHLATLAGAKIRGRFRGVIGWSPVAVPAHAAEDGKLEGAVAAAVVLGARAEHFWGYSDRTTSALRYAAAYAECGPMLLIGSQNEWVPWARHGGALAGVLGPDRCSSWVVTGTAHGTALRDGNPGVAERARGWALAAIQN